MGRPPYSSTTDNLLDFYTHKKKPRAVSVDVNLLGLDETSSIAYNSGETQTCYFVLLLKCPWSKK